MHDRDSVGEPEEEAHVVLDHDEGNALAKLAYERGDAREPFGAESRRGLVEEEKPRVGRERHADLERAPVAVREGARAHRFLAREADLGERARCALARSRSARGIGEEIESTGTELGRGDERVVE